jgi:hypothetical protein
MSKEVSTQRQQVYSPWHLLVLRACVLTFIATAPL